MLHMSRALFFPDAEDRCVMNLEKVIERLRRKRPRKMSGRQAYVRELMLELKAVSRSASHSSQALKENFMAHHVKMFNTLSPSDKHVGDTIAADLSCKHARNFKRNVQHNVGAINFVMPRARTQRAESGLMQRVSMFRLEFDDWAELFRLWETPAFSRPSVESFEAPVLCSSAPAADGRARRAERSHLLCRCGSVQVESSVVAIAVLES